MMDAFELPTTLVQALRRRAVQEPERLALRFLAEDDGEGVVLSYRDLDLRARSIAAALQAHAQLGDRAVLLFPSGPDYVAAFFGCLYAGVIAVPAYPPESARRHHQERLLSIIADAEPRLVLTTADLREPTRNCPPPTPRNCSASTSWTRPLPRPGTSRKCVPSTSPSSSTPPVQPHCPRACRSAMATWSPTRC